MRVLLVVSPLRKSDGLVLPLGVCYVAADLAAHGHEVDIYDPNVSAQDYLPELWRRLDARPYEVVGVSLRNIDNNAWNDPCYYYLSLGPTLALIRKRLPAAKLLIGGPGFSIFPELIMRRHREIDFGVFRDGVGVVSQLLDHLDTPERVAGLYYRDGDTVCFSGPGEFPDLNALPDFPWRCLDLEPYLRSQTAVGILSKAGCAFRCAHCTYPRLSGTSVRMREPRAVVDDIERLVRDHGLTGFFFVDAVFNDPPDHARAVCEELLRRQITVAWRAYFIEKHMDRSLMELAVRAGCVCFLFSPDAATSAAREVLQKATTEADLLRMIELVRQCRQARATLAFMANPPGQGFAGLCKFLRVYASTHLRDPGKFPRVGWWYPRVYPNTPLHDYLTQHEGFPASDEELLPQTAAGLKRTFWINRRNPYINAMYRAYFLPDRLKHSVVARETPHERELFRPRAPTFVPHRLT